jgi:type I restriction enzyme M protein
MAKPTKRSALEVLTKKRLTRLALLFDLEVAPSRPKPEFIEAIASSKKASFAAVLAELNRAELKDICRAHELDDSGKDEAVIVARAWDLRGAHTPASCRCVRRRRSPSPLSSFAALEKIDRWPAAASPHNPVGGVASLRICHIAKG